MAKKRPKKKSSGSSSSRKPSTRQLEKLDREIMQLANQRAELAGQRGSSGEQGQAVQAQQLDKIVAQNKGPLDDESVRALFRELWSGCAATSGPARVAFLGPEFTYSHLAAIETFGQSVEMVSVVSIAAVFDEVESGLVEYGMVPIENSTDGRITDALDCLAHSPLKICREVPLAIHHCLLGIGSREQVERICSKSQPISQCRNWLSKRMRGIDVVEVSSTGEAAKLAASDPSVAAIASHQAGVNHGLKVLARNIEDNPDNVTRFAVIAKQGAKKTGNDKTSLVFELSHQPGALADAMGIFKRQRLNLTWIESFPVPGQRGRYFFFVEFQGHASDLRARRALASLEKKAVRLTVLGSYAQAEVIG